MDYSLHIDGSKFFTWREALYLPKWSALHVPSDLEKQNIIKTAQVMDQIREFLGSPVHVHCWIRPVLNNPQSAFHGQDYNVVTNGAHHSAHITGLAVDFHVDVMTCDDIRAKLLPKLQELNIRMEHLPVGSNWVHIDLGAPSPNRYFTP